MKRIGAFFGILLVLGVALASSQPVAGKKFELGTSVSLWSYHYETDYYSDSYTILNIPVRFGWFVWRGLAIEPEVMLTIPFEDKGDTSYFLAANLAYNFKTKGKLVPFIGGTAGFGNGIPFLGWVEGDSDLNTSAFGGHAGLKYLIGNIAALRAEYKLLFYKLSEGGIEGSEEKGNIHQVLLGLSIFF